MDLFKKAAIEDARKEIMEKRGEGCVCPVCDQFVKVYKRKINAILAKQLLMAHRKYESQWFHIRDMDYFTTDWAVLHHFDLITPQPHNAGDEGKKSSGWWKITARGAAFCQKEIEIFSHILVYNNEMIGFSGTHVSIDDCLGAKFDYNELMNA